MLSIQRLIKVAVLACIIFLFVPACGQKPEYRNEYQENGTYPISGGDFNEPVAAILIDRNGLFEVSAAMGSAFLIDAKKGLFGTANHVVQLDASYKIFFCGRVYQAERVLSGVLTDVNFIRITGSFDASHFPEPYPIATDIKAGDRIFVRGIHPHPVDMQNNKILHNIISHYYGLERIYKEFTYDDLPGSIVALNAPEIAKMEENSRRIESHVTQEFTKIKTEEDHNVPQSGFRGLSGGPVVNVRNEIVGLVSNGPSDQGETVLDSEGIHRIRVDTILLISADELRRALDRLE